MTGAVALVFATVVVGLAMRAQHRRSHLRTEPPRGVTATEWLTRVASDLGGAATTLGIWGADYSHDWVHVRLEGPAVEADHWDVKAPVVVTERTEGELDDWSWQKPEREILRGVVHARATQSYRHDLPSQRTAAHFVLEGIYRRGHIAWVCVDDFRNLGRIARTLHPVSLDLQASLESRPFLRVAIERT